MRKQVVFLAAVNEDWYEHNGSISLEVEVCTKCPICHTGIIPVPLNGVYHKQDSEISGFAFFLCPSCENIYVSSYRCQSINGGFRLFDSFPQLEENIRFSDAIRSISPAFCEVYSQSSKSESCRLFSICGLGYRKSLEFLIKDYLILRHPSESEQIKVETLAQSIRRINDNRIKTLAERATWIGNDETHYVRRHEELDISDMKRFISAMLHFIESELAFDDALSIERK